MSKYTYYVDVESAKNYLQEYCQQRCLPLPIYNLIGKNGPDHSPEFQVEVEVNGIVYTGEWAPKKREAEKLAALQAWISIHEPPLPPKVTNTYETNDPCMLFESMNLEQEKTIEEMDCD